MSRTYGYGDITGTQFVKDGTPARVTATPRQGDRARRQGGRASAGIYSYPSATGCYRSVDGASGGIAYSERAAYPYWQMMLWGHEPVYRLMMAHPTIALARYVVTGPVRASSWDWTGPDGSQKTDPPARWLADNILPLRRKVMRDAIRCIDYGWQPFSVIWTIRDGMYVPDVRPLLPDSTDVLQDEYGRFAGLENHGENESKPTKFNDLESWAPTLDAEAGYAYGRSRFENIRTTAWANWLDVAMKAAQLQQKISGIVPIVTHPPNGYEDEDGEFVDFQTAAQTILSELPNGRGVSIEAALDVKQILGDHPEIAGELSKLKLFDVQFLDAGSVSPAVQGFISTLEYWDKLLFRGMLRGERSGLEAVAAGSRADSEQHTDTGVADSEAIDADLTEQFDERVVRTALRLNFGEDVARQYHVISTPLLKWKQQVFRNLLERLVSVPSLAIDVAKALDMPAIFAQMSLPTLKEQFSATPLPTPGANGQANGKPANGQTSDHLIEMLHDRFHQK
jgi:hypothetical protein